MSKNIVSTTRRKRKANRSKKVGLPAGSLVYFGNKEKPLNIEVFAYNEHSCEVKKVSSAEEALKFIIDSRITWVNVNGLNNIEEVKKLGAYTHLDNLFLEDVLDTEHRPKVEILDEHILVIIKMLYYGKDKQLISEHYYWVKTTSSLFKKVKTKTCLTPYANVCKTPIAVCANAPLTICYSDS